jgi:hypothetical protein
MAANQIGKTLAGGMETAMHATGRYPDWWKGKRFEAPTVGWACGVSGEVVRDILCSAFWLGEPVLLALALSQRMPLLRL